MGKKLIDLDYELWKVKVDELIFLEIKLKTQKVLNKKERKEVEKCLKVMWIKIWDYLPHKNQRIEDAFKSNFGNESL